jgi:predicted phosphodiesterase
VAVSLRDGLETQVASSVAGRKEVLGRLADLLERQGISVDEIGTVNRVSVYQSLTKNQDGDAEVHDLLGVQFSPSWEAGPQFDPVRQGPPVRVTVRVPKKAKNPDGYETAVILPDIQIGYFRNADGELEPTHDEDALAVALAIVRDVQPDKVVLVGDNVDAPEFGKYRLSPAYALTTQASIDRATTLSAELRACAPDAEIVWLAGNHEERLVNATLDNLKAAFGLRRGNSKHELPVLSIPYLCRFDEYGITYLPGYPASSYWINEKIKVIHGDKVRSGGSTAHAYLNNSKCSVIYGHIHRREWAERSRDDYDGPKTILAASPGTLARCDGSVPSTKGGLDLDGRPLPIVEDWQQGVGVVTYEPGDGRFWYEQVAIHQGEALFRGTLYSCPAGS